MVYILSRTFQVRNENSVISWFLEYSSRVSSLIITIITERTHLVLKRITEVCVEFRHFVSFFLIGQFYTEIILSTYFECQIQYVKPSVKI